MKTKISLAIISLILLISACSEDKSKSLKITLQASNNMYVVINKDSALVATEPDAAKAEIFEKVRQPNGKWAIKTSKGKFITDDRNKGNIIRANRDVAYDWELFEIIRTEPLRINLKASSGKFISADRDKESVLIANRDAAGDWETFTIEKK
ncbi:MAG: hypothetical protein ABI388_03890 [Bacteroidia bacterium]